MKKNVTSPASSLKELLSVLVPPGRIYTPVVKKEQQVKQLNALNDLISNESFYFVFNLLTCEFDYVKNVANTLGYSDHEFTVGRYLNSIHAGQSIQFNMLANSMYKILCSGVFKLQFSTQKYISLVALKHYNGEYLVFKKTTSVFQYDSNNRLLAQLNEFSKIGPYEGEPLRPRITEANGLQKEHFEQEVFKMVLKTFMENKFFSEKELAVLQCYANNQLVTRKELAILQNAALPTIDTYNKRILAKARATFTHPFPDTKAVALFLRKEKII